MTTVWLLRRDYGLYGSPTVAVHATLDGAKAHGIALIDAETQTFNERARREHRPTWHRQAGVWVDKEVEEVWHVGNMPTGQTGNFGDYDIVPEELLD